MSGATTTDGDPVAAAAAAAAAASGAFGESGASGAAAAAAAAAADEVLSQTSSPSSSSTSSSSSSSSKSPNNTAPAAIIGREPWGGVVEPPPPALPAVGRAVYAGFWGLARLALPLYFREILVLGSRRHIPPHGRAAIFVANHQNDLIDALLLGATCPRHVGFWAKAALFNGAIVGTLFRQIGGVPIVRRSLPVVPSSSSAGAASSAAAAAASSASSGSSSDSAAASAAVDGRGADGSAAAAASSSGSGGGDLEHVQAVGGPSAADRAAAAAELAARGGAAAIAANQAQVERETFAAFDAGKAMFVFPEGTSHSGTKLLRLKDGVAWTAFNYADHCDGKNPVAIIPVGLNYLSKDRWRSEVVVKYGTPVHLGDADLAAFRDDKKQAVKHLTAQLQTCLAAVTMNFADAESMYLAHAARRIYLDYKDMPLNQVVETARRFELFYERLGDDPEVQKLRRDLLEYERRRHLLALRDLDVFRGMEISFGRALLRGLERTFYLVVLLPLTLAGFLLNGPAILLARRMHGSIAAPESRATAMILVSLVLVPAVYIMYAVVVSLVLGLGRFHYVLLAEMVFGLMHVRFLEEERNVARSMRAAFRVIGVVFTNESRRELDELRTVRKELQTRMRRIVNSPTVRAAVPELDDLPVIGDGVSGEPTAAAAAAVGAGTSGQRGVDDDGASSDAVAVVDADAGSSAGAAGTTRRRRVGAGEGEGNEGSERGEDEDDEDDASVLAFGPVSRAPRVGLGRTSSAAAVAMDRALPVTDSLYDRLLHKRAG